MRMKYQRKTTIPMACNSQSYRNRETTSLLPLITYFFLASNSIGATCRAYSRGDYSMVAFIVFTYSAFLLLEFFLSAYHRLPPHKKSRKKDLLKYAIWFSFSAIMFGVAYQFAPFFSGAAGLSLYAVSALGSAFLFYIYIIYDETVGCAKCSREEKRKSDEMTEKKTQHYYDSILEKFVEMLRRFLVQASNQRRLCLFTPRSACAFRQCSSSSSSSSSSPQIGNSSFVEHLEDTNQSTETISQPSATLSIDRSGLYNPPDHSHGPSSDSELVKHLKGIIKFRGGPISVAEYMEEVLTNPKAGFYINRDVFGAEGDFITSPEVSQMFGEMVSVWAMCLWEQMGQPNRVNLIELGPGRGTLMADLLRGTSKFKNFTESLHIHMVECSPTLQKLQYSNLKCMAEENSNTNVEKRVISTLARTPVSWHATLEQVPTGSPTIIIAHEFFDALPVHQFQRASRGWCEKMIDVAEDSKFRFVLSPQHTPATLFLMKRCKWAAAEEIAKLDQIEVCPKAMELTQTIAERISSDGGGALIIDYGLNGVVSDSLQAIRKHKFVDILDDPGTADLSAYVDFASIRHSAEEVSDDVSVHGPITQSQFLGCLGINFRVEALLENCTDEQAESLRTGYWRLVGEGEAPFWEGPDEQAPIGMGTRYLAMAIVNKKQRIPVPFQ